jgi:hypothetical protein
MAIFREKLAEVIWDLARTLNETIGSEVTLELLRKSSETRYPYTRAIGIVDLYCILPEQLARTFLQEWALNDGDWEPRRAALKVLIDKWPDDNTRRLVEEVAVNDESEDLRNVALDALIDNWPDDNTRKLLQERAVGEDAPCLCRTALRALTDRLPDETTRGILQEAARVDGVAASLLGKMHSKFGRIVYTRDLDGIGPYLDPQEPISRAQIERAAIKAGVAPVWIDETVRSLSEKMGWDITKGSGAGGD